MKKRLFSLPVLGALWHNEETKKILEPYVKERKQCKYVRQAIFEFANNLGFDANLFSTIKPAYIPDKIWQQIQMLQQKGYGKVNYDYAIAFYWIKTLPKYQYYNKSKLIREIITNYHQ